MEVRNIDPRTDNDQNAGKVVGTAIKAISSRTTNRVLKHSDHPAPFSHLINRALNQNAGEVDHRLSTSHKKEVDHAFVGPPATSYFVLKDDFGNAVWWNPRSKSYEVKNHHAEIVRTDYGNSTLLECQSAPGNPAPNHQNAEATEGNSPLDKSLLLGMSRISSPSTRPAPNSTQNAGGPEKFVPPGMESRSPCASRPSNHTEVIGTGKSDSPFRSFLSYLWGKFFVSPFLTSGFNDPSMERVNGRWRRRA